MRLTRIAKSKKHQQYIFAKMNLFSKTKTPKVLQSKWSKFTVQKKDKCQNILTQHNRWVYKRKINFKSLTDQMKLVYKSILENGFDFQKNNFQNTNTNITVQYRCCLLNNTIHLCLMKISASKEFKSTEEFQFGAC